MASRVGQTDRCNRLEIGLQQRHRSRNSYFRKKLCYVHNRLWEVLHLYFYTHLFLGLKRLEFPAKRRRGRCRRRRRRRRRRHLGRHRATRTRRTKAESVEMGSNKNLSLRSNHVGRKRGRNRKTKPRTTGIRFLFHFVLSDRFHLRRSRLSHSSSCCTNARHQRCLGDSERGKVERERERGREREGEGEEGVWWHEGVLVTACSSFSRRRCHLLQALILRKQTCAWCV